MESPVRTVGQEIVRGEESLQGSVLGEGVRVKGKVVDLAGDRAPDQLARGVVTQVQLRGQDKQVHGQPRPRRGRNNKSR